MLHSRSKSPEVLLRQPGPSGGGAHSVFNKHASELMESSVGDRVLVFVKGNRLILRPVKEHGFIGAFTFSGKSRGRGRLLPLSSLLRDQGIHVAMRKPVVKSDTHAGDFEIPLPTTRVKVKKDSVCTQT